MVVCGCKESLRPKPPANLSAVPGSFHPNRVHRSAYWLIFSTSDSTSKDSNQGPATSSFGTARSDELGELVKLLGVLFSQEAEFKADAAKQAKAVSRILSDPAIGTVYVAREEGQVIAMASLLYTVSTAEGGPAALFEDLIVHPGHRRRGIATALVRFMIDEAKKKGVLRLTLLTDMQNERAQALYRKLGFADSPMKPMRLRL